LKTTACKGCITLRIIEFNTPFPIWLRVLWVCCTDFALQEGKYLLICSPGEFCLTGWEPEIKKVFPTEVGLEPPVISLVALSAPSSANRQIWKPCSYRSKSKFDRLECFNFWYNLNAFCGCSRKKVMKAFTLWTKYLEKAQRFLISHVFAIWKPQHVKVASHYGLLNLIHHFQFDFVFSERKAVQNSNEMDLAIPGIVYQGAKTVRFRFCSLFATTDGCSASYCIQKLRFYCSQCWSVIHLSMSLSLDCFIARQHPFQNSWPPERTLSISVQIFGVSNWKTEHRASFERDSLSKVIVLSTRATHACFTARDSWTWSLETLWLKYFNCCLFRSNLAGGNWISRSLFEET